MKTVSKTTMRPKGMTPRRALEIWATIVLGLTAFGPYFISGLLIGFASELFNIAIDTRKGLVLSIASITATIVSVPLIIFFVKLRRGNSFAEYIGLRRFKTMSLISWLAIAFVIEALSSGLGFLLKIPPDEVQISWYVTSVWPPLFWIGVIVFGPVFEEVLFRGFLFEGFRRARMQSSVIVVTLAVAWTLLHVTSDFFALIVTFVIGIALGIARLKTRSLWVPLSMHAFWNFISMVELAMLVARR